MYAIVKHFIESHCVRYKCDCQYNREVQVLHKIAYMQRYKYYIIQISTDHDVGTIWVVVLSMRDFTIVSMFFIVVMIIGLI